MSESEEETETQKMDEGYFDLLPPLPPSTPASSSRASESGARRAFTLPPSASLDMGGPLALGSRADSAPAGSVEMSDEDRAVMGLLELLNGTGRGFELLRDAFIEKIKSDQEKIENRMNMKKKGKVTKSDVDEFEDALAGEEFENVDLSEISEKMQRIISESSAPASASASASSSASSSAASASSSAAASASASDPSDPAQVLDDIVNEINEIHKNTSVGQGCINISRKLIFLLKKLGYALFYLIRSGIRTLNGVYESKLYFRITVVLLLLGYMLNDTCASSVNWLVGSTINMLCLFVRAVGSKGTLERLDSIAGVMRKTIDIFKSIGNFTLDHGVVLVDYLRSIMDYAKTLPEGTFNALVQQVQGFSQLMSELKVSADDIKNILKSLTELKLSGDQMLALLKGLMTILSELQANQAMAPVRETILQRLTDAFASATGQVAGQATLTILGNIATAASHARLTPGGEKKYNSKKTRKRNRKVTKKQKKRRKQNKKTKRK